ncbi:hypothetical protein [Shewanella dokdonensis]|uniref:DUF4105 domain-containing protein n=1 Tax=Shewanella dokdonensis TaxID=712036 RepID=A0ABX8DHM2_9GAMM|nr:hypothetical protein [Shewanella dokdonensis]MCL1076476.1 hypothetical protein [Shewanella dokdonensis]QVK23302.1 hypothetical protein KHX94_00195 [Shewanella dokdonensis]
MITKKFNSRKELSKWLRHVSGILLLSVSYTKDVSTIIVNTQSPRFVAEAMDVRPFPKGQYLVKYEYIEHKENSQQPDDIPYMESVWGLAYDANLFDCSKILQRSKLIYEMADFEYCISTDRDSGAYRITSLLAKKPENPLDLEKLLAVMKKYTEVYSIGRKGDHMNEMNTFFRGKQLA